MMMGMGGIIFAPAQKYKVIRSNRVGHMTTVQPTHTRTYVYVCVCVGRTLYPGRYLWRT